ncbi:MAG TPA: RNA polymerase subunit sigma-70 [Phycisphaerales bacterium]|nr:RNA polymerase subunit sigma-70 [Phycisphaerales bacterium]
MFDSDEFGDIVAAEEGNSMSSIQIEEKAVDSVLQRGGSTLRSIAEGFKEIYPQLRSMASVLMRQERASHTLQPTAIVSEAFLRLAHRNPGEFANANNLLAVTAHAMRCVLVDHARSRGATKRGAAKRGGDAALAFLADESRMDPADVFAIDEALTELAEMDARAAQVLECKVFAGMTVVEIAEALGISRPTVNRDWRFGRAFLAQKLGIELNSLEEEGESARQ